MRCFGFTQDGTLDPDEATHIRYWSEQILTADATSSALAADANARGVSTVTGGTWKGHTLKRTLTNPRMRGTIMRARDYDKLVRYLKRAQKTKPGRRVGAPVRRYLLTGGIARCGWCGAALQSQPSNGVPSYVCRKSADSDGCNRIRITASKLEDRVAVLVIAALASTYTRQQLRPSATELAEVPERLADARRRLVELGRDLAEGLDREVVRAAQTHVRDQITHLEAVKAQGERADALLSIDPEGLADWWTSAPVDRRRELVLLAMSHVDVLPQDKAKRGRHEFAAERVRPAWRVTAT